MYGYGGILLRINLSTGKIDKEDMDMQDILDFVGGRGFGIKYLYQEVPAYADPLGPQNKLILATGVLAGTSALTASRWVACTKSPLTGCYARASAGGDFGAWMKFAGYDFFLIEGAADKPVYVHVTRDGVQIEDAGEKLVKFASIVTG